MLILKVDKVVCFESLLQVLILKGLYCTNIVHGVLLHLREGEAEGRRIQRPDMAGAGADHRERRVRRAGEITRRGGLRYGAGVESRIHDR